MLRAATEMINRTGLTISLDHISFEDVIRDAGVARSTAYRQSILDSPGRRTYLALHAAFSSLSDGEQREQVRSALAHAEAVHTGQVAQAWQQMAGLFGYRLRPELSTSFEYRPVG
jgi:hypothetical protein